MELLAKSNASSSNLTSFWRTPAGWLRDKNLGRGYWTFFSAAFFFDTGFSIYFFLFNLYLFDRHWNERDIGWVGRAMTLGSLRGAMQGGIRGRKPRLGP